MKKILFLALAAASLSLAACDREKANGAEGSASGAAMTSTRLGDADGNEGKVDTVRTDAGTPTNNAVPDTMAGQ
ncbi:hypothetical protein LJ737_14530 [Hymenobacter sp. 15J16-1T3B]|uniref:hypothetical protein n=1 Tax=Hymenobacter sp. 15J16-1T3B TaxID=2886941 RepID=UPI001D124094|nr:hypothetical protein [Hymenobacter sp. 15J16-1T3B]MCC3158463.1 hypothetical protein [Hymenobacter sp. 15J16-1T3B]